jgi:hypothetical protein
VCLSALFNSMSRIPDILLKVIKQMKDFKLTKKDRFECGLFPRFREWAYHKCGRSGARGLFFSKGRHVVE